MPVPHRPRPITSTSGSIPAPMPIRRSPRPSPRKDRSKSDADLPGSQNADLRGAKRDRTFRGIDDVNRSSRRVTLACVLLQPGAAAGHVGG